MSVSVAYRGVDFFATPWNGPTLDTFDALLPKAKEFVAAYVRQHGTGKSPVPLDRIYAAAIKEGYPTTVIDRAISQCSDGGVLCRTARNIEPVKGKETLVEGQKQPGVKRAVCYWCKE